MHSTMYKKALFWKWELSCVARWYSSITIDYSDYLKRLITRIDEVCVFL